MGVPMVKKTEDFLFDDDDFFREFDDNAHGDFKSTSKVSSARKVISDFGGSFLSGVKQSILNPSNQRRILEKNLPDGYAQTFDAVSMGAEGIKDLYSSTKDEIAKQAKDFVDPLSTLTKIHGKNLPPKLREKIEKTLENNTQRTYSSPTEEETFDTGLEEIFGELTKVSRSAALSNKATQMESTNKIVGSQMTQTAVISVSNRILSNISKGTDQLVSLNTASAKLLRKNVELTFKQFVLQRKMLDELEQTRKMQFDAFSKIIRNTAMPEVIKATNWELAAKNVRGKLIGMATERATAKFSPVATQIFDRLRSNMSNKVQTAGGFGSMMLSLLATQAELENDMGMGPSRSQRIGGMAGRAGAWMGQRWLSKKIGDRFKNDPRFQRYGDAAMNFMDSSPGMFNRLQNSYGLTGQLLSALGIGDILVPDSQAKTRVRGNVFKHFDEVTAYNKKSDIALTEIIPGLLGKLLQSSESMRTGTQVEELRYDYEKSGFATVGELKDRTLKQMYGKTAVADSRKHANIVVNRLDSKGELSKKDRALLMRYVIEQANSDVGYVDPKALMDVSDSPINKYDSKAAERIANVLANENNFNFVDQHRLSDTLSLGDRNIIFGNLNSNAQYQRRMRMANTDLKDLRRSLPNSMNQAIQHAGVGNIDILREIGAVKWDNDTKEWRFDREAFYDNILSGKMPNIGGGSPGLPNGTGPRPPSGGDGLGGGPRPGPRTSPIPGPIQNSSPSIDIPSGPAGYTDFQTELLSTLERVSAKPSADIANQILEAIRERLDMGIPQGGPSATPEQQNRKSRWFRNLIGSTFNMTGRGMKSLFKFSTFTAPKAAFKSLVQTPFRIIRGITDLPGRAMSAMGFGGSARVVDSSSRKFSKMMGDIYVKGKEAPVIKLADLKAGKYFDQSTKKVIRTFKDIKGAIVDELNNVIVSEEEYREGIYTIVEGKKFSIIGGMLRAGLNLVRGAARLNFMSANLAFRAVTAPMKFIGKGIWNILTAAKDVYVQGESSPRLLARIMRNGGYFNTDGSPINSVKDIKGVVVDGTGDTILTVADISKGLVDKHGKPFRSVGEKIRDLALAPFRMMGKALVGSAKFAWKASLVPFKLMGKLGRGIGSMFSKKTDDPSLQVTAHTAVTIDNIYQLLQDRLPKRKGSWNDRDGSGFRDGSREDQMANRKGKDSKAEDPQKAEGEKDRKGILGILMTIAGGLGSVLGAIKGWAGNIFGLMRMVTQARLASSALSAAGALGGLAGGGNGRRGGGIFSKMKSFFSRSKVGRIAAIGGLALAGFGLSRTSFAQDAMAGASSAMGGGESDEIKNAVAAMSGGSTSGGSSSGAAGSESLSFGERMMNGVGGSMLGELGAIAAFPLMAMMYNKVRDTKLGSKLPEMKHGGAPTIGKPDSKMSRAMTFLMSTTKGRMLLAGLTGAGVVGGTHALTGGGGESLTETAATGFGGTLAMELALATAMPWAVGKAKDKWDAYKARKAGIPAYSPTPYAPYRPANGANLAGRNFTPVTPGTRAATIAPPAYTPHPTATGGGMMGKAAGLGKGFMRNAGILGTGYALYDAATTEGGWWDKTKAFGTSLATSAAIGKGLSVGSKLFSVAGRQALMQGGRSALMYGGTALASTLGMPVVIGGLALAAAGYAAWKGYKYFFGTDKNAIVRYRMAQYGFKLKDKDKVTAIGQLEQLCQQVAVVGRDGKAGFGKNIDTEQIFKIFGFQSTDKEAIERFITWFNGRFKPVFLQALGSYQAITKRKDLEKADALAKKDKLQLLNSMSMQTSGNPYTVMVSPFPDGAKLSFDADGVKDELDTALRNVNNEKGPGEKSTMEKVKSSLSSGWDKTKSFASDAWDSTVDLAKKARETLSNVGQAGANVVKAGWDLNKSFYGNLLTGNVKGAWNTITSAVSGAGDFLSNTLATMTGDQKAWQMRVYTAFKNAGFSEQQARILTAEIGRENSYNPKYLFGGHADPHKGTNLGMLSWQGDRKPRLIGFLKQANVLDGRGNMIPGQNALDAQARFIMWELKNTHKKVGAKFLANPNISYNEGAYLIGKSYILWRIDDPKYSTKGKRNRDGFYNMLLKQLGAKDGDGKSPTTPMSSPGNVANTPLASMGATAPQVPGKSGVGTKTIGGYTTADRAAGGYGGGTNMASSGITTTTGATAFIKSIDPKLIELGKKATRLADNNVNVQGMVQPFMVLFYAMVGEAVQRGVVKMVQVNSAYRSIEKQRQLYNDYVSGRSKVLAAKPGGSKHNFGIAIDINSVHANALNNAGLLTKYNFHRPLAPKEQWHLENRYFEKGKGTVKEVAKTVNDSTNRAAVVQANKQLDKKNPVTVAETKKKEIPPTIARPQTQGNNIMNAPKVSMNAEDALRKLAGGNNFLADHPSAGTGTGDNVPPVKDDVFNLQNTVPNIMEKVTSSSLSRVAADRRQKTETDAINASGQELININREQLNVQNNMLHVLEQIRDGMGNLTPSAQKATEGEAPPPPMNANRAAELIRQKSKNVPVSMSIKN